jgi:arginase family enzyme
MLTDFLDPLNLDEITEKHKPWATTQLGTKVEFYDKTQQDFEPYKLALIGVLEDRASVDNHGCGSSANAIRKELYQLYAHGEIPAMIDFGNILPGQTVKDTQFALKEVLKELFEQKITVIILGGGHDLTFGQYLAYENSFHHTDIVLIDEKIDIRKIEEINSNSFLWHLLNNEPSFLSSITHLGHQLFYTSPENIDILETLDFDTIRLGEIRNNIFEIEPFSAK